MKADLTTAVLVAIVGVVIAFFVTNMIIPGLSDFKLKTLSGIPTATVSDPDSEVFNYRAINPTVEVYVGQ